MRVIRAFTWTAAVCLLSLPVLMLLLNETPSVSAQTGTPPSSSISSTSGPVSWDFAAVGGGTVTNVGIQDICPPAMCDDHDLTLTDPIDGVWHIRSVASLVPVPTAAHVVITMTVAPRPTSPLPPPPAPGAPAFIIYPAPNDCVAGQQPPGCIQPSVGSTTAGEHGAGEPSIGADWATRKVFIQAGNHTLRV